MRVLISNDDGVDAPGIWALYREISKIAETVVVAPTTERSAVGHGISVYSNITLQPHVREGVQWAWGIDGTPADCVKMALTTVMKDNPPDLVISGINRGENTGTSIIYSGTVAAALEGTMSGLPAIAVSLAVLGPAGVQTEKSTMLNHDAMARLQHIARHPDDYIAAARFAARLARSVHKRGLPRGVLLNVNVPSVAEDQIAGVSVSKMGHSVFVDEFKVVGETAGIVAYRNIGNQLIHSTEGDDWDDLVLKQNRISVTPLHYDWTHHHFVEEMRKWIAEEEAEARSLAEEVADGLSSDLDADTVG